jgi:glycosyltransferase involved in cell wall biosynthesis
MREHAARGRQAVHLVNPLWDPNGGADRRTIATWHILREVADVRLWTEYEPAPAYASAYPVRRIRPLQAALPGGGTLVFVGVYFRIGHWIRLARPERCVVIYNTDQPDRLAKNLRRIGRADRVDVVVTSRALNRRLGARLPTLESPIDLSLFAAGAPSPPRPFTVGRLSRDDATKHHAEDAALYRRLAAAGCRVRIMGGTCLAGELAGVAGVELLPAGAEAPRAFLHTLDCFVYRTAESWFEGFGRVVFEAMACGLPVVCARRGGYADYLTSGRDALVFDTSHEAASWVLRLRDDATLRQRLGDAAVATARATVGEDLRRRTREMLLTDAARPALADVPTIVPRGRPAPGA